MLLLHDVSREQAGTIYNKFVSLLDTITNGERMAFESGSFATVFIGMIIALNNVR